MSKKIAIIVSIALSVFLLQRINIKAETVVNKRPIECSGPYNMPESEICSFESIEKVNGYINDNYDKETGNYLLQESTYGNESLQDNGIFFATFNGNKKIPLSWSENTYNNMENATVYMGVLKPTSHEVWSDNFAIVWDTNGLEKKCALYVTASKEGPRDLKIECSIDGGKTYNVIGNVRLKNTGKVQNIFENISYKYEKSYLEVDNWDEMYRISIASDYKLDGSEGLYGSSSGELVVSNITVYESFKKIGTMEENDKVIKTYIVKKLNAEESYSFYVKAVLTYVDVSCNVVSVDMKKQLIPKDISIRKKLIIRKGKKKTVPLKYRKGGDKSCVKKITYHVSKKKILKIKNNKIIAKKKGTSVVKMTVVLKNGMKKILRVKVIVK